jgi:hypothetical protein
LFVQLLYVCFEHLVVNYIVFVNLGRVVSLKDHVQDLIKNFVCYVLNCQIFHLGG